MNIHTVILSLSRDQFRLPFFRRQPELIFIHLQAALAKAPICSALALLFLAGPSLRAEPTTVVAPPVADDPLAEALPILQSKYPDFQALNYRPGDHLNDLISRSEGKLMLGVPETAPMPILTATLPDGILYWRLASFVLPPGKNWPDFAAQLRQPGENAPGLILDLRSNATPDDYDGAKLMRKLFDTNSDHAPIVVLTNDRTVGAAEAFAGYLQAAGAIVVGRPTAGRVAVFQEDKLSSGQFLRYVVPSKGDDDPTNAFKLGTAAPAWGRPVIPDIALKVNDRAEKAALVLIRDNHISDVIEESAERHRLSEASLVQGQDPELDDYLASLEKGPVLLSLPVTHDVVLISALDSLRAIRLSERPLSAQATTTAKASTQTTTSSVQ